MRRTILFGWVLAVLTVLGLQPARAGLVNDIPSCYAASHYTFASAPYTRLLYVLIDQVGPLSPALQHSVVSNINGALGPGTKFVIAAFSGSSAHRYLHVLHTGIIESPMTAAERGNVPVSSLDGFNSCMRDQAMFAVRMADTSAAQILQSAGAAPGAPNGILDALRTVAPVIAQDPAQQKVLFLVTDGIENSSFADFAASGFSAQQMLAKARAQGLIANFGGAQIYVLGAGYAP